MNEKYKIGYTTGVFDLFHIGHLNILKKAKEKCDYLIVGVSTDENVIGYKNKTPVIPFKERFAIVESIKYVNKVVAQKNMDKINAWEELNFDAIFVGSDWLGTNKWREYEGQFKKIGVEVIYIPYTNGTSSTKLNRVLDELLVKN